MAFGFENLRLSGYDVQKIETCKIEAEMGEHTTLKLRAILNPETKDEVIHTTGTSHKVEVYVKENGEKISLFYGIVTKVNISFRAEVYWLEIEAKSYTYLMDSQKHSRSFQNINMTYHQVIKTIMTNYPHSDCIIHIPNEPIGQLLVQYEETDWQFIKRLASAFNEGLFPAVEVEGIRFFVGIEDLPVKNMQIKTIDVKKDLDAYYRMKANSKQPIADVSYIIYAILADEVAYLMHYISLKGHDFYIKKLIQNLKQGLLINHYEVQLKAGLKEKKIYPMHLVGASLKGKIIEAKADKVRVHLDIDVSQEKEKAYWFPYSTLSASNDGSGWYCMPEVGDTVTVYFPTKYTKDAVALSSVSLYDSPILGEDRMQNPDVKYLRTVHDKELKLAPEGIRIACNGSVAVLNIGKQGTISLYGQKSVNVTAEENLTLQAKEDLVLTAIEEIELSCDKGGKAILDQEGNIQFKGTEVKVD